MDSLLPIAHMAEEKTGGERMSGEDHETVYLLYVLLVEQPRQNRILPNRPSVMNETLKWIVHRTTGCRMFNCRVRGHPSTTHDITTIFNTVLGPI